MNYSDCGQVSHMLGRGMNSQGDSNEKTSSAYVEESPRGLEILKKMRLNGSRWGWGGTPWPLGAALSPPLTEPGLCSWDVMCLLFFRVTLAVLSPQLRICDLKTHFMEQI